MNEKLASPGSASDPTVQPAPPIAVPSICSDLGTKLWQISQTLGPGLVTGASDDDPSGIATYSQVGARFGYGMLWTMIVTYPLMAAIQEIRRA